MTSGNSSPTVRNLAPQGKRPPFLILAILIFLPVVAWGVDVSNFTDLQAEIGNYNGTVDVEIIVTDDNISITSPLTISASSTSGTLTIKSDGTTRTLTRGVAGNLFTLESGTLIFDDIIIDGNKITFSSNTGSLVYLNGSSANFEMIEGAVLENNKVYGQEGGGVHVGSGTFTMSDGEIKDNGAEWVAAGVYVDINGTFIMNGGEISNNSTSYGGGVSVKGTFTMSGGKIKNNSSADGGGVLVDNNGTFIMSGGEISGNSSGNGGGVSVNGTFTMTGGEISGNSTTYSDANGGGVFSKGTFTVGGTAKIFSNTKYGDANNVYLYEIYLYLGTGPDAPQDGMQIYVQTTLGSGTIVINSAPAGVEQYFYAEEDGKAVAFEAGQLVIKNIEDISPITTFQQLKAAISAGRESIIIGKSFAITEPLTIENNSNITIKSEDNKLYTLISGTSSNLFTVNSGELKLEDIIIDGNYTGFSLISIDGGSLVMEHGTVLKNTRRGGSPNGGGVVLNGGTFKMNGGEIRDNSSTVAYIGGVAVYSGSTFIMTGGKISGNTAPYQGGGVYVSGGTFTMSGGEISGNTANYGSGVYVGSGTFTMSGGEITANNGSGVHVGGGTFTMSGGTISGNTATDSGGGVFVALTISPAGGTDMVSKGTFKMNGGEISGNSAIDGGGVYVGGTFEMNDGKISDNSSTGNGGGVYVTSTVSQWTDIVYEGTFEMNGGEISGNTVNNNGNGGGVYVKDGTFAVGGTAKIFGNTKYPEITNNVRLYENNYIELGIDGNAPQSGMQVYIQTTDAEGVIVSSGATEGAEQYFYADELGKAVAFESGQLIIKNSIPTAAITLTAPALGAMPSTTATSTGNFTKDAVTWSENPSMFLGKAYTATVTLTANEGYTFARLETATINGQTATVTNNGNTVTLSYTFPEIDASIVTDGLELKAAVLTYEGTTSDNIIKIGNDIDFGEEDLTIKNTNITIKSIDGEIYTIMRGVTGNIFTVGDNGTLVFENIIIDASNAVAHGSIVFVDDINAEFEMKNGAVLRGNTRTMGDDGGGVYVESGSFTMSGGEISGNSAPLNGGGVYVNNNGTFTVGGTAKIFGNTQEDGNANNVYLNDEKYITLGITPQSGMQVYVQTATANGVIVNTGATENDAQYFHADLDGKAVVFENNKLIIKNAISAASISLTAPETGETPNTEATTSHANFTLSQVTWEGDPLVFTGSTKYTATVTLIAKDGYTFTKDLTATIDGPQANVIENTGNTATISHTFHETTPLAITEFEVTKQPAKLQYTYGDRFDWSGLEVKLTYTDKTTEDVAYKDFEDRNITVREDDFTAMTIGEIKVTIECGSHIDSVYLTVGKAKLAITAEDKEIIYGDAAPNYTATYSGLVNNETANVLTGGTITSNYEQGSNAGEYTITASGYSSDNYEISYEPGTLTVGKRDLSNVEIAEIEPVIYTGEEYKPIPSVSDGNLIKASDYNLSYANNTEIGTAILTLTATANGNYTGTKTAEFRILEKPLIPLTITADNISITYGDAVPTYTVTITESENDLTGGTITSDYAKGSNAGEYTITPSGYTSDNYAIEYVNGTLTVGKRDLSNVTIEEIEPVIYTGEAHEPIPSVSDGNLIKASDYTISYSNNTNAGTATVTLTATATGNYTGTKTAEFRILEKPLIPLTITADSISITYGDTVPTFTATYSGFINGDGSTALNGKLEFDSDYTPQSDVGEYDITPHGLSSDNYDIKFIKGTLTVTPAELAFAWINEITVDEGLTLADVILPEGYAWVDTAIFLKAGDRQFFEAIYTRNNHKEARGFIVVNVAKTKSSHVIILTAVITHSNPDSKTETIDFEKQEELSTLNKTVFFANTNSCGLTTTDIKIAVTDQSLELKVNDELLEGEKDHNNNFTLYNKTLELHAGFDTLFYDFSKEGNGWRDTAIIVSPIPFDKIIKQKWGLLIVNSDPASNGGYKLTEYNWFKNGEEKKITLPYYRLNPDEKIDTTNLFNVQLKTEENIKLNTCEGSLTVQPPPEQQSAYKKQVLGINGKTANGKVYNIKGKLSTNNVPPGVYIVEEKQ